MKLHLCRLPSADGATIGKFSIDGVFECFTCEDVIREPIGHPADPAALAKWIAAWKVPGATAIPVGMYRVVIDDSQRFQRPMPHVLDVPGFSGIRIHAGNTAADTEGCILVGRERTPNTVLRSRDAFDDLMTVLQAARDEITITIENPLVDEANHEARTSEMVADLVSR